MKAVYSGSFDPPTLGHLDIIRRSSVIFPELIVALGIHPTKKPMFTVDERLHFLRESVPHGVRVESFSGLLVDFCHQNGVDVIIRGLRSGVDFDYEFQMALANRALAHDIETFFLPASPDKMFLSSSAVREIASYGHDITPFVPECVARAMESRQ